MLLRSFTLCWMLVEGLLLWSKVVAVNLTEDQHMKYYYLIGWGLPVLIVTITLASASGKYSADNYCWLSVQNGIIWGFAGPVIFIIMVSKLDLIPIMLSNFTVSMNNTTRKAITVKAVLVLLPILGLTWLCGVLVKVDLYCLFDYFCFMYSTLLIAEVSASCSAPNFCQSNSFYSRQ
uniref:G-protein coupled receptors family 2 profile 2 domain-containing protein n=1 Tax=Salarias fasciatus TaxID=181472 RepID=A0A672J7N1_SALFA